MCVQISNHLMVCYLPRTENVSRTNIVRYLYMLCTNNIHITKSITTFKISLDFLQNRILYFAVNQEQITLWTLNNRMQSNRQRNHVCICIRIILLVNISTLLSIIWCKLVVDEVDNSTLGYNRQSTSISIILKCNSSKTCAFKF